METATTKITCPNCKQVFSIEDSLSREYENTIKERYKKSWEKDQAELQKEKEKLQTEQQNLREQLQVMLVAERTKIIEEQRKKVGADYEAQLQTLTLENEERNKKVKELLLQQAEFEKQKRDLQQQKEAMALEIEKKLNAERTLIIEQIQKQVYEATEMKLLEKDKLIADLNKNVEEMKRKSEQGSMQTQGEVMELALEEKLKAFFPRDKVSEVGKGIEGADIMLTVTDAQYRECGTILFESKRTKHFSDKWIDKLKNDVRNSKAQAAVIVTSAMPKDMMYFGQVDGIWICRYDEAVGVATVLRDAILKVHTVIQSQENKGDKMTLLYNFLTSEEFTQQMNAIMEGFSTMKESVTKEKTFMAKVWAEREKQAEKVLLNAAGFYGSIKGIAGSSIPDIKLLEEGE